MRKDGNIEIEKVERIESSRNGGIEIIEIIEKRHQEKLKEEEKEEIVQVLILQTRKYETSTPKSLHVKTWTIVSVTAWRAATDEGGALRSDMSSPQPTHAAEPRDLWSREIYSTRLATGLIMV